VSITCPKSACPCLCTIQGFTSQSQSSDTVSLYDPRVYKPVSELRHRSLYDPRVTSQSQSSDTGLCTIQGFTKPDLRAQTPVSERSKGLPSQSSELRHRSSGRSKGSTKPAQELRHPGLWTNQGVTKAKAKKLKHPGFFWTWTWGGSPSGGTATADPEGRGPFHRPGVISQGTARVGKCPLPGPVDCGYPSGALDTGLGEAPLSVGPHGN